MHDVILSLYGKTTSSIYPEWEYILESFQCRNYLLMDNDVNELYNLTVSSEGFNFLLDIVVNHYDILNNRKLQRLIKKNLPQDYDTTSFSKELRDQVFRKENLLAVATSHNAINIWDVDCIEKIKTIYCVYPFVGIAISDDNKFIVTANDYETIIMSLESGETIRNLSIPQSQNSFRLSSDNVICQLNYNCIAIFSFDNGRYISTLPINDVSNFEMSRDGRFLAVQGKSDNKSIFIWNMNTREIHCHFAYDDDRWAFCFAFSNDSRTLVSCSRNTVTIWNIETGKIRDTILIHHNAYNIFISHDNQYIAVLYIGAVEIWNIGTKQLIHKLIHSSSGVSHYNHLIWHGNKLLISEEDVIKIFDIYSGSFSQLEQDNRVLHMSLSN